MKKYELVYEKMKQAILYGQISRGQKLPSIRASMEAFGVSKSCVEHAYSLLVLDGFVHAHPQSGYVVDLDSRQAEARRKMEEYSLQHPVRNWKYDLRPQSVLFEESETALFRRYLKEAYSDIPLMSSYGDSQGEYILRLQLSRYAWRMRGAACVPEQIVVGSNYQSLLFILCSLLKNGLRVAMEPFYSSQARKVFASHAADIRDLDLDHLEDLDLVYINSACMGPERKPIDSSQRARLLEASQKYGFLIVEDDYNGELTYVSPARNCLFSSALENVIYCGSFSRLLLPSLRISYMILPAGLADSFRKEIHSYGPQASKLEQTAFASYIQDGHLDRHIRRLKKEYRRRSTLMKEALEQEGFRDFFLNEAYLCYCLHLDDTGDLSRKAAAVSLAVPEPKNGLLQLSFASLPADQIAPAISLFASVCRT